MTQSRSTLARIQQALAISVWGGALAWLVWHWTDRPALAVAGGLVIACGHAIFLGAEFLFLRGVSGAGPDPRPQGRDLFRAWWAESAHLPRIFYWRQPFRWRAVPDVLDGAQHGKRGVVFLHGFVCNRGFWAPWMQRLAGSGHAMVALNLEPVFGSIDAYADSIESAVVAVERATGLAPLLVCHSMGGLAARAWLRAYRGDARVHRVVTIGSPHHGTWLARFGHLPNTRQMRRGGPWLQQLEQDEAQRQLPPFTCWRSHCDNIVFPTETAMLPGADNRLVQGPAHVELGFHPQVVDATLALLAAVPAQAPSR
jgi:hypothetical protein